MAKIGFGTICDFLLSTYSLSCITKNNGDWAVESEDVDATYLL